jgi:hypothetical protein
MNVGGRAVLACDFPYRGDSYDEDRFVDARPVDRGGWLLHEHVHKRWRVQDRMINVGVDAWHQAPVSRAELIGLIELQAGTGALSGLPTTQTESWSVASVVVVVVVGSSYQRSIPPPNVSSVERATRTSLTFRGRRVQPLDPLDANLLLPDERVGFHRPRLRKLHHATFLADGTMRTIEGQILPSPCRAAVSAANVQASDGWNAWQVPRLNGAKLQRLRQQLMETTSATVDVGTSEDDVS